MNSGFRLGVDTGGTFTDLGLVDETTGRAAVAKVSSTPDNPAEAVINGIRKRIAQRRLCPLTSAWGRPNGHYTRVKS